LLLSPARYNLDGNGKLSKPYLHLALHGMRDKWNLDIEIGTLHGKTCSPEVKEWFVGEIKKHFRRVQIDGRFCGDPSKSVHRCGDKISDTEYLGYGKNFNTIQIEISRTLRENCQKKLINTFTLQANILTFRDMLLLVATSYILETLKNIFGLIIFL